MPPPRPARSPRQRDGGSVGRRRERSLDERSHRRDRLGEAVGVADASLAHEAGPLRPFRVRPSLRRVRPLAEQLTFFDRAPPELLGDLLDGQVGLLLDDLPDQVPVPACTRT